MQKDLNSSLKRKLVIIDEEKNTPKFYEYDPYKIPPDLEFAKKHAIARRICKDQLKKELNVSELCSCCYLTSKNELLPYCCCKEELYHLGVCFPLYFEFIKFSFVLLLITLLSSGIYAIITNHHGLTCDSLGYDSFICIYSYPNTLSLGNSENPNVQSFTNVATMFILMFAIEIFCKRQRKIKKECDIYNNTTPTKNSVLISKLADPFTSKDLRDLLTNLLKNEEDLKIIKEYLIYDIAPYADFYRKKKEIIIKRKRNEITEEQYQKDYQDIEQKIYQFRENFVNNEREGIHFTGRALVTFLNPKHAKELINLFEPPFWGKILSTFIKNPSYLPAYMKRYTYRNNIITILPAPEPSDILWENLGKPASLNKANRRCQTLIASIVLLVISFVLLYHMKLFINVQEDQNQEYFENLGPSLSVAISFVSSTVVALSNTCLGIFIRKFAREEKHKTQTNFFRSVAYRLTCALFFNMSITTLLANFLRSQTTFQGTGAVYEFSLTGLLQDIFFLFITNSYISSIFNFFDILWGVKLIRRIRAEKADKLNTCRLTQEEANTLFEGHPVDMALRYANILKTLFFTGIYAPFVPMGLLFSLVGMVICYWVDKKLLLRRYISANKLGIDLPKTMLNGMRIYVLLFAIGNIILFYIPGWMDGNTKIFRPKLENPNYWISVFGLFAAIIYNVLPMNKLNKKILKVEILETELRDSRSLSMLDDDYDFFHPVLKENVKLKLSDAKILSKPNQNILNKSLFQSIELHLEQTSNMENVPSLI